MKFKSSPLGVVALVVGVDGFAGEPDGDVAIYIYIYIYIGLDGSWILARNYKMT
jgi:hypothetical protein